MPYRAMAAANASHTNATAYALASLGFSRPHPLLSTAQYGRRKDHDEKTIGVSGSGPQRMKFMKPPPVRPHSTTMSTSSLVFRRIFNGVFARDADATPLDCPDSGTAPPAHSRRYGRMDQTWCAMAFSIQKAARSSQLNPSFALGLPAAFPASPYSRLWYSARNDRPPRNASVPGLRG